MLVAFLRWSTVGWLLSIVTLGLSFRLIGERLPAIAVLLFMPPAIWMLPLALLLPVALVTRQWKMVAALSCGVSVSLPLLWGYNLPLKSVHPAADGGIKLTFLTHNIGQRGNASLQPFKNAKQPDFLVLQDAPSRARRYLGAEGYREFSHADNLGEFTLVSRYPIVAKELILRPLVPVAEMMKYPLASRFEVNVNGTHIAIYSVHAFSPRSYLSPLGILRTIGYSFSRWVPGSGHSGEYDRIKSFWDAQIQSAEHLLQRMATDPLPSILAGDFNAPAIGLIYRKATAQMRDSHREAGVGCGFTLPGTSTNPLSLFGPWLRLDYIMASGQWHCLESAVEPSNPSQHRALAATFVLSASRS
jgi:endonuclease/exonuclease/phosphatase (EEP) superfamily protein YafD